MMCNNDNDNFLFTYDALQFLITDENEIMSILQDKLDEIILVPFKINLEGIQPFNTFILVNDLIYNNLTFPVLDNIFERNVKLTNDYNLLISTIKQI